MKSEASRADDECDGDDEDSKGDMQWGKKISILTTKFDNVMTDLEFARRVNPADERYSWEKGNVSSMWRVIDTFAKRQKKNRTFMGLESFRKWSKGQRKNKLPDNSVIILRKFHSKCKGDLPWDDTDENTEDEADKE